MMSTRRSSSLNFTMPLVLEPPRHGGLSSIALVPGRHLVGAGADCAIRLQAEGILDRHAMILVGENRTVVKAIDSRTWVNDGPVSEMALRAGDRLSIGPLTFRVRAAAKDELAAFEIRESLETGEQPDSRTPNSNFGNTIRPMAVAAPPESPGPPINAVATIDARRPVQQVEEVVVQPAKTLKTAPDHAAVHVEHSGSASLAEKPGPAGGRQPAVQAVASVSPEPEEHTGVAGGGAEVSVAEDSALERRLDEIQKRLADLGQADFSFAPLSEPRAPRPERGVTRDNNVSQLQSQLELNARTEQLAREASELQQRIEKIAEREALLEQRQLSLVQEAERIAQVAEMARQSLAEEHAEHFSIWQEWEGTFQRLTSDLAAQLSAFERQRDAFKQETQRFQIAQVELRNARADHERERQAHLADRIKLQNELADLNALRSQQDRLHLQSQRDLDEQSIRLEVDRKRLQDERAEIATLKIDLLRQRQVFDLDRSQFDVMRTGMQESLRDLQARCQLAESDLTQSRQKQQAESIVIAESRENEAAQFRELRNRLEEAQLQLQSEQNTVTQLRRELEIAHQALDAAVVSQVNSVALAEPTAAVSGPVGSFALGVDALGKCDLAPSVANLGQSVSAVDSGDNFIPLSPPDEGIWSLGSNADHAETVATDVPQGSSSPDAFGVAVDWSTLAAIEQEFGQGTEFSRASQPLGIGDGRGEVALNEQFNLVATSDESSLSATLTKPSIWPEQTIWPAALSPYEGGRTDDQVTLTLAATAKPVASVGQTGDDPWGGFSEAESTVETTSSGSSLDEIQNAVTGVANEPGATDPIADFAARQFHEPHDVIPATNDSQDARQTLAEVNREFGTAVQEPLGNETRNALPAWWVENTKAESRNDESSSETGKPSWVLDALRDNPGNPLSGAVQTQPEEPGEPANQLRSQLAMLFELPVHAPLETERLATEPDSNVSSVESAVQPVEAGSDGVEVEAVEVEEAPSHRVQGEDSVEAFMARLLARSRTGNSDSIAASAPIPNANTAAIPVANVNPGSDSDGSAASISAELDRSHLMQGPKHKQDRQAVRENLQSFRQVAHLSARSALAKHSMQQLRNATIAKGVLLAASGIATIWFFGEPLIGRSLQLWKGAACSLGLILSAIEFSRSWRQLMKPIRVASASNFDLASADAETSVDASESATTDVSPKPVASEANPVEPTDATTQPACE